MLTNRSSFVTLYDASTVLFLIGFIRFLVRCLLNYIMPLQANKKTRNRAYDILVEIGHACGDEEKGGTKENLLQFFNMVCSLSGC